MGMLISNAIYQNAFSEGYATGIRDKENEILKVQNQELKQLKIFLECPDGSNMDPYFPPKPIDNSEKIKL